ncbi:MHYT domain-containing protein [Rhodoblastus sp.]|uniref:MHYT domain-containing protein n=1 Tax=Rhodoblastus sp. TaxID=1962975 RepID=UPI0035B4DC41
MVLEPWLVALSVVMAVQGGYVGLTFAMEAQGRVGLSRKFRTAVAALTLAVGVWTMHFVGILAAELPNDATFLVLPTLVSFLICVIVVGVGVCAVQMPISPRLRIAIGALAMGSGIFVMHFLGMFAIESADRYQTDLLHMVLSLFVAISASALAMWLLNRSTTAIPIWLAAVILGVAIAGMHYTAMAGTSFVLCAVRPPNAAPVLSRDSLAIVVALIGFTISGGFLLSFIPERSSADQPISECADEAVSQSGVAPEAAPALVAAEATPDKAPRFADFLTVEKDGRARTIPVGEIRSVRANAHYTYISDGKCEYFCKLPINAVEASLDGRIFMRVHRSYLVAIPHVGRINRHGENSIVEIKDASPQRSIPVARGRTAALRQRVALLDMNGLRLQPAAFHE